MEFESYIRENHLVLSQSYERLMAFILSEKEQAAIIPVRTLAEQARVSTATVSRFVRQLGFSSYGAFQDMLKRDMMRRIDTVDKMKNTANLENSSGFVMSDLQRDRNTMEAEASELDEEGIAKMAQEICKADCVYIAGLGSARAIVEFLSYRFSWMGIRNIRLCTGGNEFMEQLVFLNKRDLLISAGFRKTYQEIEIALDYAKEKGAASIGICEDLGTGIARKSRRILPVKRGPQGEWNSLAYPMSVCNILIRQVLGKRKESAIETAKVLNRLNQKLLQKH